MIIIITITAIIILITIITTSIPRGLEIPGGSWCGIFSPLAVRLKCTKNKVKTRSQNTYNIVRRVGKQGTRPPKESN